MCERVCHHFKNCSVGKVLREETSKNNVLRSCLSATKGWGWDVVLIKASEVGWTRELQERSISATEGSGCRSWGDWTALPETPVCPRNTTCHEEEVKHHSRQMPFSRGGEGRPGAVPPGPCCSQELHPHCHTDCSQVHSGTTKTSPSTAWYINILGLFIGPLQSLGEMLH